MAAENTPPETPPKKKAKAAGAGTALRLLTDPRKERRFEPRASAIAVISILGLSVGAVLLGAGTYGQWLRPEALGPFKYAPWLLLGGALLLILIAFAGPRGETPLRVGDAGVGREKDGGEVERLEWRDITRVAVGGDALTLESPGQTLMVSLKLHAQAAARIVSEARRRIPAKLDEIPDGALEALDTDAGEVMPLEVPQIAGAHCKATDKPIAFERDARLCGKCGEVYHKDHVPPKCLTCDAKLK
jgi:hypothetical protein